MTATRSALIVTCDDYADPGLGRLRAPSHDAAALARVLGDDAIGGFGVHMLHNRPAHEVIRAVDDFFADRGLDDLLVLHLSCHGVKDEAGELHFATTDTELRRLASTSVSADFVNRRMTRSRSRRIVLLLDCCYSGAFERGLSPRAGSAMAIEEQLGGRGRAVITASSAMEYAFEGGTLADDAAAAPSVFTTALVAGLETGDADQDQDGWISLDELYDYVFARVRRTTPNQTPSKWTFGLQGELYLARRARPVSVPTPLPPELQQVLDNPLPRVRAAGVEELTRLLHGSHAGLALAARQALEALEHDDSRTVGAAASAALSSSPPAPARTSADSGANAPAASPATGAGTEGPDVAAPRPDDPGTAGPGPAGPPHQLASLFARKPGQSTAPARLTGAAAVVLGILLIVAFHPVLALGVLVVAGAAIAVLREQPTRLTSLAFLIGVAAAATAMLVAAVSVLLTEPNPDLLDLMITTPFVLLAAAGTMSAAAVARTGQVHLVRRLRSHADRRPRLLVAVAAGICMIALIDVTVMLWPIADRGEYRPIVPLVLSTTVLAATFPWLAATVVPARVAAWLLAGWLAGATILGAVFALLVDELLRDGAVSGSMLSLGLLGAGVMVMAAATVSLGRQARATTQEPDEPAPPTTAAR